MAEKPIELSIEVSVETKRAIERAAAARGVSVSDFVEEALQKLLTNIGYLDDEATH